MSKSGAARPSTAAVLGAGSWGTAFAKVMADAGCQVRLWARRAEIVSSVNLQRSNPEYLPGVMLPSGIEAFTDAEEAISGAEIVVLAVPSQSLRNNLAQWAGFIGGTVSVVSLMKGVELGSCARMSEVITQAAGVQAQRIVVVTGPNLAGEIASEQPAATVVAGMDLDRATAVQAACTTPYLRPYTNTDVIGCELGGAVKNIIALGCGMADGMGFGDNTKASLMTRGLAETARLGAALGADPLTFSGLAGLGDLVATCSSPLSRNHSFGTRLGRGEPLADIVAGTRQVAEGVKSCRSVRDLARSVEVEMPLTEVVTAVCEEELSPRQAVAALMGRKTTHEVE